MKLSEERFRRRRQLFWQKTILSGSAIAIIFVFLLSYIFWIKAAVVEVIPEVAALKAERALEDGWGWVLQDKIYLLSSEAVLKVAAPGFITEKVALERHTLKRRIAVKLKEAPAIIKATAAPADERIQWYINAEHVASGAELKTSVKPGTHALEVMHPYYQPQKASVSLARGAEKELEFILEPVKGQIDLSSKPAAVPVLLDGNFIGETPILKPLPGGHYRLQIETPDFETVNDAVEISYQQPTINRNYQLIYKRALISFTLVPAGGQLRIDGKVIPTKNMPLALEPQRELAINYSKDGYFAKTIRRTFKPNQKEAVSFSLKAEFGKVLIKANPIADIKIDDKAVGQTPQTLMLSALPHRVRLSKPGYRAVQKTIRPNSRNTIQINETLLTEQQARLSESPAVVKNSIGIELVLFKPIKTETFKLGAHRSEKGQRANEILRTVSLDKAFYVSRTEISAKHYHAFDGQAPASNLALSNVSWGDAARFCNWLSTQENLPHFYIESGGGIAGYRPSSIGYRLLSEAEWEWLARYAKRSVPARFVWGNQTTIPKGAGNFADESAKTNVAVYIPHYNDGYPRLAPVASFKQDSAGLHDLAGNVSEWVHDTYTVDNAVGASSNPLGISNNTSYSGHVVKGSSWRSGTLSELRSSYRQRASDRADDRGFRIARYIY